MLERSKRVILIRGRKIKANSKYAIKREKNFRSERKAEEKKRRRKKTSERKNRLENEKNQRSRAIKRI